jgi:hypothetical protein
MSKYSRWNPNRVYLEHGQPTIYNKVDKPIRVWEAERQFKKAVHTMHTWATRSFRLSAAAPDPEMRDYYLRNVEWELGNIAAWLDSMHEVLAEARGKQREQEKIDKLLALAERTTFPEEADTARRMAADRQRDLDGSAA